MFVFSIKFQNHVDTQLYTHFFRPKKELNVLILCHNGQIYLYVYSMRIIIGDFDAVLTNQMVPNLNLNERKRKKLINVLCDSHCFCVQAPLKSIKQLRESEL